MQNAAKREAAPLLKDLADNTLIPSNDTGHNAANENLAQKWDKKQEERLESLMALQLESELAIDHLEIVDEQDTEALLDFDTGGKNGEGENPGVFASGDIDHDKLLAICKGLAQNISNSARILDDLGNNSSEMSKFLGTMDDRSDASEESRSRISQLEQLTQEQSKKIETLETALSYYSDDSELDLMSLVEGRNSIEERFAKSEAAIDTLRDELQRKNKELQEFRKERDQLESRSHEAMDTLRKFQAKFYDVNRRSLELQSRHHQKVKMLETQLQQLKAKSDQN